MATTRRRKDQKSAIAIDVVRVHLHIHEIIAKFDEDKSLILCIESIKDFYCYYYYLINGTRKIIYSV